MATELGINSNGQWTAAQYVIDATYDRYAVDLTAEYGTVSDGEAADLTAKQQAAIVEYCREKSGDRSTVRGHEIYRDHSDGQGHCWRRAYDVPPTVVEEIAAEIIDGGNDSCDDFVASNGQHYRWA